MAFKCGRCGNTHTHRDQARKCHGLPPSNMTKQGPSSEGVPPKKRPSQSPAMKQQIARRMRQRRNRRVDQENVQDEARRQKDNRQRDESERDRQYNRRRKERAVQVPGEDSSERHKFLCMTCAMTMVSLPDPWPTCSTTEACSSSTVRGLCIACNTNELPLGKSGERCRSCSGSRAEVRELMRNEDAQLLVVRRNAGRKLRPQAGEVSVPKRSTGKGNRGVGKASKGRGPQNEPTSKAQVPKRNLGSLVAKMSDTENRRQLTPKRT